MKGLAVQQTLAHFVSTQSFGLEDLAPKIPIPRDPCRICFFVCTAWCYSGKSLVRELREAAPQRVFLYVAETEERVSVRISVALQL